MNQEKKIQEITVFFLTESRFESKHNVSDRKDSSEFLESSQIFSLSSQDYSTMNYYFFRRLSDNNNQG